MDSGGFKIESKPTKFQQPVHVNLRQITSSQTCVTVDSFTGKLSFISVDDLRENSIFDGTIDYRNATLTLGDVDDLAVTITRARHNDNVGGHLTISGGDGAGTDKTGGNLTLQGGASTGNVNGGEIYFRTAMRDGSSDANPNSYSNLMYTYSVYDRLILDEIYEIRSIGESDFHLSSDLGMDFTIDVDNDTGAGLYFTWKNYTTWLATLDDSFNFTLMQSSTSRGLTFDGANHIIKAGDRATSISTDQDTTTGAANTAGVNLTIAGGAGTGTGNGGGISFGTYPAGSAGINVNSTYEEKMAMDKDGNFQIDGTLQVDGASITFDSVGVTAIQTSGESFADNDTSLMTSAAIDDRINAASGGIAFDGSTANGVLTYKDADEATVESSLTYDSEILNIGDDDDGAAEIRRLRHTDEAGGDLYIRGGDATGTDKAGGDLMLFGGRSTSNAAGGSVIIKTNPASGSSGTALQSSNTVATFRADGDTILNGNLIFEGPTPDAHETTFSITDPTADQTITVPNATGTMCVSGSSGSNMIILDSGSHYLQYITADEWYFGNNSFGRNYHYWNNVKASITADGGTFTISEDSNLIGRLIPEALSKVKLQLSARPSGGGSTGEVLSVCIVSADRDAAGSNTTWTVLAQGEITQTQGEYDGVDITYTGSIPTTKMLAVGVGSTEASSISTTNTRFTYTLTGYLT